MLPGRGGRDAEILTCIPAPHPQFGKYLDENKRTVWATQYVDYKALKDLIKDAAATAEVVRGCAGAVCLGVAVRALAVFGGCCVVMEFQSKLGYDVHWFKRHAYDFSGDQANFHPPFSQSNHSRTGTRPG